MKFDYVKECLLRHFSHVNSRKQEISRLNDDNEESSEYIHESFKSRIGGIHNLPDLYDDVWPVMCGKKPVKPKKGMRKFKGSDSIRKANWKEERK